MGKRLLVVLIMLLGAAGAQVSSHTAFRIRFGAALPATCSPNTGDVFFKTAATIGAYQCLVANTWSAMGAGGAFPDFTDNAGVLLTATVPILLPAGTAASGSLALQIGAANYGFYKAASSIGINPGGATANEAFHLSSDANAGLAMFSGALLSWVSANDASSTTSDTFFGRRTAANFRYGAADLNGVPVAQTLSFQNAITGSNLVGTSPTIAGALGTGTGLPAPIIIQGADQSVATGTTAQTEIPRFVIGDTKNLTTGAATTVLSIPLATLQMAGGHIIFHMEATDGTNQCTRDGAMSYSAENSAGVFVTNVTDGAGALDSTACTAAKTLTLTWAVTSANPALVQVTPTLTGITATRFSLNYTVYHGGNTVPTL